ncbi:MMOB1630 family gliding motility ATPase complex subunit [Mycoplasmopsis agassizii]|uniref:MMOB1630 family gliding motility ATPase complex subunit n=1 Tax=Mycoplasmopsis agassizii TaxID=33922 RepID=UPI003527CF89
MKRNELEDKKRSLEFYHNYTDISKITLLRKLSIEIENLNVINNIKSANNHLLNKISNRWLKKYNDYYEAKNNLPGFFILVDPSKLDDYSKVALAKLTEQIERDIKKTDYVVTVGLQTAALAEKYSLQVVENLEYSEFENIAKFAEKISSLVELGLNNNIFGRVKMIFTKNDIITTGLVEKTLFPLDKKDLEIKRERVDEDGAVILETSPEMEWANQYIKIIESIDLKKTTWQPDIANFYNLFARAIIKSLIFEVKIEERIADLRVELQILDQKKKDLEEKLTEVQLQVNRIRKEETTLQSMILHTAFKTRKKRKGADVDYKKYKTFVAEKVKKG